MTHQEMVAEFMEAMGQALPATPGLPSETVQYMRLDIIDEELDELKAAVSDEDLVAVSDALGDLLYVVYGMALAFGIDIGPVMQEIHRTNMQKTTGPVRADGKKLKPPGWQPPDLRSILLQQGATL